MMYSQEISMVDVFGIKIAAGRVPGERHWLHVTNDGDGPSHIMTGVRASFQGSLDLEILD